MTYYLYLYYLSIIDTAAEPKKFWDSRFYPIYHHGYGLATVEVAWEDPNTDIDVYLYGEDVFNTSKLWKFTAAAPVELPPLKVLKENGHSTRVSGINVILYGDRVFSPTQF